MPRSPGCHPQAGLLAAPGALRGYALLDSSRTLRSALKILDRLKAWMTDNNAAIMAVLCLVIGAKLIGDAISGF
jgi:hypothetical protein